MEAIQGDTSRESDFEIQNLECGWTRCIGGGIQTKLVCLGQRRLCLGYSG